MKKLLLIFIVCMTLLLSVACSDEQTDKPTDDPSDSATDDYDYPEGALPLTVENISTYFDIKVKTELDYNGYLYQTKATTYVALVPKGEYSEVVGEIKFDINTKIRKSVSGNLETMLSNTEQRMLLSEPLNNMSHTLSVNGGSGSVNDPSFRVVSGTDSITLNSVYGYVIPGNKTPSAYDSLTDGQKEASFDVLAELTELVSAFEDKFNSASSFNIASATSYKLGSIYGSGLSVNITNTVASHKIDLANNRFTYNDDRYLLIDGVWANQYLNAYNLVQLNKSSYTIEDVVSQSTPTFALFDPTAIYVKRSDRTFEAYTTLSSMQNSYVKEKLIASLDEYGVTTRYNEFVVVYTFSFEDNALWFNARIDHVDYGYHVHYVDIDVTFYQNITELNSCEVELYSPDTHKFALADNLEEAKLFNSGLVTVDGSTELIYYTTFGKSYEGYTNPDQENYLPVRITEGGVYKFSNNRLSIYDSEGRAYSGEYFEPGMYYIELYGVLYGVTNKVITVSSDIYDDYGSLSSPTPIGADGSFSAHLEANADRVTFSYSPEQTGMYEFPVMKNVSIYAYYADELDFSFLQIRSECPSIYLEEGTSYVFAFVYEVYGGEDDPAVTHSGNLKLIGNPTTGLIAVGKEPTEIFIRYDTAVITFTVDSLGEYSVSIEVLGGWQTPSFHISPYDGGSIAYDLIRYEDGKPIYTLTPGDYLIEISMNMNAYLKANVSVITVTEGVEESREIEIGEDPVTVSGSTLTTILSNSKLYFNVDERSTLFTEAGSSFYTLYSADGTRIGSGGQYAKSYELEAGRYYIFFERTVYTTVYDFSVTLSLK